MVAFIYYGLNHGSRVCITFGIESSHPVYVRSFTGRTMFVWIVTITGVDYDHLLANILTEKAD